MSRIEFKESSLEQATHVEVGGKVYELDVWESGGACKDYEEGHCVGITVDDKDEILSIPISLFPILGIKLFKEIKREPIEFEFIMSLNTLSFFPPLNVPMEAVGKRFRCVEILEEEK